jgi:hypothetical protein
MIISLSRDGMRRGISADYTDHADEMQVMMIGSRWCEIKCEEVYPQISQITQMKFRSWMGHPGIRSPPHGGARCW